MSTEQANPSTVNAAMTAVEVAMAADHVAMAASVPPHSPPSAGSLSDLQPIKEVGVIFLDEPKRRDWDSILPKDPDSLLVRMKVQTFMHQYKEKKEAQRQQVAREWHAERMRQAAHMCATRVVEPALLFPPQRMPTAAPWTREDDGLVLNDEEVGCTAVTPSTGHEQNECTEQHQHLLQADGHVSYAVETKATCCPTAKPTYPPPAVTMASPPTSPPSPATSPHSTSPPPPAASPPPPAILPPPTSPPPPAASPPPPAILTSAASSPRPPNQPPSVNVGDPATEEQVLQYKCLCSH